MIDTVRKNKKLTSEKSTDWNVNDRSVVKNITD